MKSFIQTGDVITITAPTGGVASGAGVLIGSLFGVAAATAAEGDPLEIATTGVYELPKDPTAVLAIGDPVAWDDTAKQVDAPGAGLYPIGIATKAAGSGVVTCPLPVPRSL
jgi:predicted RecA/RadA family phage recombinase